MGTSFNNQWVLARARSRGGERAAAESAVTSAGGTPADEAHEEQTAPSDRHHPSARRPAQEASTAGTGRGGAGFGPALAYRNARKHPRWIDRDM